MKKEKYIALLSFVFCVSLIVGLSIACGGSDSGDKASTASITGKVGQTLKTDEFEITVTSVSSSKSVGGEYFGEKASEGAVFVIVNFKSKNITNSPISSSDLPEAKLIDPNDIVYEEASGATISYQTDKNINTKVLSDLNPGVTEKNASVFEVSSENWKKAGWRVRIDADEKVDVTVK